MAIEDEPFWREFVDRLERSVSQLPAHLLREEDIRTCLRDALLAADERYNDPWHYLPEADKVDVRIQPPSGRGFRYDVELKLWHATLKHGQSGGSLVSQSSEGTAHHLADLRKLLGGGARGANAYFVALTQATAHPQAARTRWHGGTPGPFAMPPRGKHAAIRGQLSALMTMSGGEDASVELLPFSVGSGKRREEHPACSARIRVVESSRWRSGGGSDWSCDFDFRVWEVGACE